VVKLPTQSVTVRDHECGPSASVCGDKREVVDPSAVPIAEPSTFSVYRQTPSPFPSFAGLHVKVGVVVATQALLIGAVSGPGVAGVVSTLKLADEDCPPTFPWQSPAATVKLCEPSGSGDDGVNEVVGGWSSEPVT